MKFKVIDGKHQEFTTVDGRVKTTIYKKGEVIETDVDLAAKFNRGSYSIKFELVSDDTPTQQEILAEGDSFSEDSFSDMTVVELKESAAAGGIDLEGATKKEDILKALRLHLVEA